MLCYTALVLVGLLDILTGVHGAPNIAVGGTCPTSTDTCIADTTCQTTCKLNVGQVCVIADSPTKCVDHATCKYASGTTSGANGVCTCDAGYGGATTCSIQPGYLTGSCTANADCVAKDPNSQCTTNVCACKTGYTANGIVCNGAACAIVSLALLLASVVTSRFL